jgi:hypothetical protein
MAVRPTRPTAYGPRLLTRGNPGTIDLPQPSRKKDGGIVGPLPWKIGGLVAWYDPSDLSTLIPTSAADIAAGASAGTLYQISDKSPVGVHLTNGSMSANRPRAVGFPRLGGQKFPVTDAIDSGYYGQMYLFNNAAPAKARGLNQGPMSFIGICNIGSGAVSPFFNTFSAQYQDSGGTTRNMDMYAGFDPNRGYFVFHANSGYPGQPWGSQYTLDLVVNPGQATGVNPTYAICSGTFDGTFLKIYSTSNQGAYTQTSAAISPKVSMPSSGLMVGNLNGYGVNALNGNNTAYNHEVMLYNKVLSDDQRMMLEGYLAWKYFNNGGAILSAGHPYSLKAP